MLPGEFMRLTKRMNQPNNTRHYLAGLLQAGVLIIRIFASVSPVYPLVSAACVCCLCLPPVPAVYAYYSCLLLVPLLMPVMHACYIRPCKPSFSGQYSWARSSRRTRNSSRRVTRSATLRPAAWCSQPATTLSIRSSVSSGAWV